MKPPPKSSFELSPAKRALLEAIHQQSAGESSPGSSIPRRQGRGPAPLSFGQEGLWFLDRLQDARSDYNISLAFRLKGPLEIPGLKHSFEQLLQRHEILRTRFPLQGTEPVQVTAPSVEFELEVRDLRILPQGESETEARRLVERVARRPFNLALGPLIRVLIVRLGEEDNILALILHHIVSDEWSMDVLLRELSLLYTSYLEGKPPDLPLLTIQFADFAVWQRQRLEGPKMEGLLAYWMERLANPSPALELPEDFPRSGGITSRGGTRSLRLPGRLMGDLQALSQQEQGSLFALLLAAFAVLLYHHTDQPDLLLGSPVTSRDDDVQLEGLVGYFLNTLVLRCDLSRNPTFRELVGRIRHTTLDAFDHKDLPFEKLVEALGPVRDLSRNPLFQVMFVYRPAAHIPLVLPGVRLERFKFDPGTAIFDLTLYAEVGADGLGLTLNYNADLFDELTIERLLARMQVLLEGIVAVPDSPIDSLPVLARREFELLADSNRTRADYPRDVGLDRLFERQAALTPESVALEFGDLQLTYRQLDQSANRLARYLQAHGVGVDVPVGIFLERSADMIVSVLAVLKAGGAYLPLDPSYPPERLAFIVSDAQTPVIITQRGLSDSLPAHPASLIILDEKRDLIAGQGEKDLEDKASPHGLAYVIYTSGSTGNPKGVAMGHQALSNLVTWHQEHPDLSRSARTLQLTSLNFDVSFQEIASTLCTGGTLVLVSEEVRADFGQLLQYLEDCSIERLFLPFVALQTLAEVAGIRGESPTHLREVITAGERLRITPEIVRFFESLPGCSLHNHYGPTECHVVTAYTLTGPPANWPLFPPIGRPIANCAVYLLDEKLQPVPLGVRGGLYVAGENLASGYLHRPMLTGESFLPNPFHRDDPLVPQSERLYRTGDLARYRLDGELEFLGRSDDQVKIRGYRVEPGEVEAVLSNHPGVRKAVVIAREDPPGERRLVAYIVAGVAATPSPGDLREHLLGILPEYMVPKAFVFLEALPLTPNGKVDRQSLPAPSREHLAARDAYVAPQDDLERQLAEIWQEVLGLKPIGLSDDFFDLGGHSMLAIRLFALMEERLGQRQPLALLFKAPTIRQLAENLREPAESADWSTLVPIQPQGSRAPFFCVHGFGGGVVGYATLAALLGEDQPFYGLQARGLSGLEEPDVDISTMASRYLETMRAVQPQGPYHVGGYCFGGVVAYEIACQLQAQGEKAALVAILEGYAPLRRKGWELLRKPKQALNFLRNLPFWMRDYVGQGLGGMWAIARRRITIVSINLGRRLGGSQQVTPEDIIGEDASQVPAHVRRMMELQIQAQIRYHPTPYAGKVTLFRVRRLSLLRSGDPLMGWGALAARGVEVRMIAGSHNNILEEPQVRSLAEEMRAALSQAQDPGAGVI